MPTRASTWTRHWPIFVPPQPIWTSWPPPPRSGQPVRLPADLYGRTGECPGNGAGLGAGTGSACALLPAQNATGNWIKVVQRVPVRVALDPAQLVANPLRVGLSMDAVVDVSNKEGKTLADASHASAIAQTQVYSALDNGADAEVRRVIAGNTGHARLLAATPAVAQASMPAAH